MSHLRHWSTILLAVAAAAIAVLQEQAQEFLRNQGLFEVALGVIGTQAVYAILRVIWYGKRSQYVLYANLDLDEQTKPYLYRLDSGVTKILMKKHPFLSKIHSVTVWWFWTLG